MTTSSQHRTMVLSKRAVLVHAADLDVSCIARLRIDHGQTANHGSISLSIMADLANLNSRSQLLTLNIPPERVEKCRLAQKSNDGLCSPHLISKLPAGVTHVSAVSTLSLSLGTTGVVLCPSDMDSLSPAKPGDSKFHSFAKICQSKYLRVHLSRRQFVNKELDDLQTFSDALRQRSLRTLSQNYIRHGVVQKDWRVFNLLSDPPPYFQVDPPPYRDGKRGRDSRSISPIDHGRKRLLPSFQPISSPTEVNTPSTLSPSPSPTSIRPTYFGHGQTEFKKLARLENELRGVSDDQIRELLIRSGRQHLLAMPKDLDHGLLRKLEKVRPSQVEMGRAEAIERRLDRIERRLDGYVSNAVSDCRDQIYDAYTTNQAEFREQIDDGNTEVRTKANECMSEIKEQAQRYMLEMEEQAQQHMEDIENQGFEVEMSAMKRLGRCSSASAQSLLDSKSSPSHELGTNARCRSI